MRRILTPALFALALFALPLAAQQPAPATAPQATPAAPQKRPNIPDTFTNLKVLAPDITKPQLMSVMRQMSITFHVRCSYCHAVADDLSEGSFSSDEKAPKEDSRKLLRIIHAAPITDAKPQALPITNLKP